MRKMPIFLGFIICLFCGELLGSVPNNLAGHWEGEIVRDGRKWRVRLDIQNGDGAQGTAEFPDYGLYALPALLELASDRVIVTVTAGSDRAVFTGKINGNIFAGEWNGLAVKASFRLRRTAHRPRDLYRQENVQFRNGEAVLAGTLIRPNRAGPHPAIVFVHGSGNQTRTESFYRSRAYFFARHGIAARCFPKSSRFTVLNCGLI